MVQLYLLERKWAKKLCVKFFKRLVNVAVHNAVMVYNSRNKTHHLTYCLDLIKALILTHRPQVARPAAHGRLSVNPQSERLLGGTSLKRFLLQEKKNKIPKRSFCLFFVKGKEGARYTGVWTAK
jgi:hypothetical protein